MKHLIILILFITSCTQPKYDYWCSHDNPNYSEGLNPNSILLDTEQEADDFCELVQINCGCLRTIEE